MPEKITCWDCIHLKQGTHSMFCNNPKQTDERLKKYVYPPIHVCDLREEISAGDAVPPMENDQ